MTLMEVKGMLDAYYQTKNVKDLETVFTGYMKHIGAARLDRRYADTSNTFQIKKDYTGQNRVECYYYKNSGDYMFPGLFDFCITLRKKRGNYLVFKTGSERGVIQRAYEIAYGTVTHDDEAMLMDLVTRHQGLFRAMAEQLREKKPSP